MLDETITRIREKLDKAEALDEARKTELKALVSTLEAEVHDLARTRAEHAESIASFAQLTAHEATRQEPNPHLLRLAVTGLRSSVSGFESSHPRLVETVNAAATMLSNLGI